MKDIVVDGGEKIGEWERVDWERRKRSLGNKEVGRYGRRMMFSNGKILGKKKIDRKLYKR